MRYSWLPLVGALLAPGALPAQQAFSPQSPQIPAVPQAGQPAVTLDPAHNRLDALLIRWANEMSHVQSLEATIVRTTKDKTFGDTEIAQGMARYLKPDMASVRLDFASRPGKFEQYVWSGNALYEFRPQDKLLRVHALPPRPAGQLSDDSFVSFIFGMKAEEVKRRYDMRLAKENENWAYIYIYPRYPGDKVDFQRAELVLNSKTMMPRRLWFEQPNKNEITWDLPRVATGLPLDKNLFVRPPAPAGWRTEMAPKITDSQPQGQAVPPRVIRPQG